MSEQPPAPKFDASLPHQARPKLRPVRGFPAQMGEQMVLGLADQRQISERVVFMAPAVQLILPMMDGNRTVDQIVAEVGRGLTHEMLEGVIAQLDDAALLFGPRFEELLVKVRNDFDASPILPPASTASFVDAITAQALGENATEEEKAAAGPAKLREVMDQWIAAALKDADKPSFDSLPRAVVAPHLDYSRGWLNYAHVYGRMRVADRPDRVVILGTNHFGFGTGVVACDKGYQTALGTCEPDSQLLDLLKSNLGTDNAAKLLANRYDHEREHSIELHVPWIQHCLGTDSDAKYCKVLGILIHDPAVDNGNSYDGQGLALQTFLDAMKKSIAQIGGRTLIVSSADLSHVGAAFGDQVQTMAGDEKDAVAFRNKVFQHDRDMIELVRGNKPDELVAAMCWQQNPTRWCSTGNLVATLKLADPADIQVLNYTAAMDQQGLGMVSSIAMVMN
ncbi:MAG: AmmeMemoRadiSam system protein B [Phycisphaerales bacterium]|nr:AmmeMemoRadiSam system protein B [Phycisphaerales bacterium]